MQSQRSQRVQSLGYKRSALASLAFDLIWQELNDIQEECCNIQWMAEDEELLLSALEGNEDDLWEFKMTFSDLSASVDSLLQAVQDNCRDLEHMGLEFDDCMVSMLGNRYKMLYFDDVEEDYYALSAWDKDKAITDSDKRLMKLTKADLLATIGQCMGIALAYLDIRYRYDYLKATFDVLEDSKAGVLQAVRQIEQLYDRLMGSPWWSEERRQAEAAWDKLMQELPQRVFLE